MRDADVPGVATAPPGPALSMQSVSVQFGAVHALDDVNIDVARGDIHAVIGPNGAGKSSLFNAVSGLYPIATGRIEVHGESISELAPFRVTECGVGRSFQNVSLSGDETVEQTLLAGRHHLMRYGTLAALVGLPRARREEKRHRARVEAIAEFVGVAEHINRRMRELAYGQQKLVDLARAICSEPRVLLLDEPAAGLNSAETDAIADVVRRVRDSLDISAVLVEHDMGMVMSLADQVTVLDFGRVIGAGTPAQVQADDAVRAVYLGVDRGVGSP